MPPAAGGLGKAAPRTPKKGEATGSRFVHTARAIILRQRPGVADFAATGRFLMIPRVLHGVM
jgi:hypothetical protein